MSMGVGKQYFVHVIQVCFGDIDECIKFMEVYKPKDNLHWFELRPIVHIDKKNGTTLSEYQCSLVEEAK